MRTAKEIMDGFLNVDSKTAFPFSENAITNLINLARKEAIEECAKVAKAKLNSTALENALSGGSYLSAITNQSKCYVDKESILSLINKLQ